MQFFTEQTMDQFLAESGQALDYVGLTGNGKPEKQEKLPIACWTFSTEHQSLGVLATNIQKGILRTYKRNKTPTIYHMFESNENGKTSTKILKVIKPLQVFATVATIIAEELKENKQMTVAFIRYPSTMGASSKVASLTERYLRKYGLSNWVVGSTMSIESKKLKYLAIVRKGNDSTFDEIFNTTVNEELFPKGVPLSQETALTDVEQEELDKAGKKIEQRLEPKLKAAVPDMVSIIGVAGNGFSNPTTDEFIEKNPSVIASTKKFEKRESVDAIFDKIAAIEVSDSVSAEIVFANAGKTTEWSTDDESFKQIISDIDKLKIEISDVIGNTAKISELRKIIKKNVENGVILSFDDNHTIESVMIKVVARVIRANDRIVKDIYKSIETISKPKDKKSVSDYTGSGYKLINESLLGTVSGGIQQAGFDNVKKLDDAFENSGIVLPKNALLYRSMKLEPTLAKSAEKSMMFHFRTFVSTSLSPTMGLEFAD